MRAATTSTGCFPDDVPGPAGPRPLPPADAVLRAGGDRGRREPGDHRRARLRRAAGSASSTRPSREVDRITSSRGPGQRGRARATASASRPDIVVSDLGVPQTVLRLLRDVGVGHRVRRRIAEHPLRPRAAAVGQPRACTSRPATLAEADNPGRGRRSRACTGGPKDLDYAAPALPARDLSCAASPAGRTCCRRSTASGTRRARRAGSHIVGVEEFAAPRRLFSPDEWRRVKARLHRATCCPSGRATRRT